MFHASPVGLPSIQHTCYVCNSVLITYLLVCLLMSYIRMSVLAATDNAVVWWYVCCRWLAV